MEFKPEFLDTEEHVYTLFADEYHNQLTLSWSEFVETKDLGVEHVKHQPIDKYFTYTIVDEKKWLLARIKYGI